MQPERLPQINNEQHRLLRSAIFDPEITALAPEHAAMFAAENDACFMHFAATLSPELHEESLRAERGDREAIAIMSSAYQDFRDLFESELAAQNPDAYNEFIESVASGDAGAASVLVDEFFNAKALADLPVIDDELDAQFI